jgi:hypothetical protein
MGLFGIYARRALLYPTLRQKTPARKWLRRRRKAVERNVVFSTIRSWARARRKTTRRLGRRTVRRTRDFAKLVATKLFKPPRKRTSDSQGS